MSEIDFIAGSEPAVALAEAPAIQRPSLRIQHGSLSYQVAALAIWPLLEQCMTFMVGFVDTSIAGHMLPLEATDAVGAAVYVMWLMQLLFAAAGVGATALISRAVGQGQWRRANLVLGQAMFLAAVWGTLVAFCFYYGAASIASLSGLKGESHRLCSQYMHLLAMAAPCSAILGIGNACLRGAGDTRTPFLIMGGVNCINIGACLLFVAPSSPFGGHGIEGLGLGTTCAWVSGALLLVAVQLMRRKHLHLKKINLSPRRDWLWRIARVGLPNLLESVGFWAGNYLILIIVGHLPQPSAIGTHIVTSRIEALSFLPGFALGTAASTLVGQHLGAGHPHRARQAAWWCWFYGAGLMTTVGIIFILWPEAMIQLVTDKPLYLANAPALLRLSGFAQIGLATANVFSSVHRGAGDTRTAMFLTYGSVFLVRLPLVYYLGVICQMGLYGVWIGLCTELMFRGAIYMLSFIRGKWAFVKV